MKALVLALGVACTPVALTVDAEHPANPSADIGRLAGPPAALRLGVAEAAPLPMDDHDHGAPPSPPPKSDPPKQPPSDAPKAEPKPPAKPAPRPEPPKQPPAKPAPSPEPPKQPPPTHDHGHHH